MNIERIKEQADEMLPWLVDIRRDFHMHPELGREEFRTQQKIIEYLEELDIPYTKIAGTGVVGIIEGAEQGKVVALRGDIDALPIQELSDIPYKSTYDGKMHACGHDAHTTIVLGAAKILKSMQSELKGTVKLFFQPDEESDGGAEPMIKEGCLENPKVDYVMGLHMQPAMKTGTARVKYGHLNAASDTLEVVVKGASAHAAYPEAGVDAIMIAGHVITALQSLVSRNISPLNSAVVTLGTIRGGTKHNVIANEVRMDGTLRTLDPETRQFCYRRLQEIVSNTAKAHGGEGEVIFKPGDTALINHDEAVDVAKANAELLLGKENVTLKEQPSLGVEDFAYYLEKTSGAFFHLGCGNEEKKTTAGAHTGWFNVDEDCLPIGVALQVMNTLTLLG
ncbi:M20 family metallopeptidase [Limibacter armeniacum]|uniref:M20 metallopeptidase family protein n=1 Tax=Limibacter armeniacum TaxID=466084 RepID=UPI002FE5DD7F